MTLTPVERAVLIALMASGGGLRENADLVQRLKIGIKASHRKKLAELGLITTRPNPFWHELTPLGWRLLVEEFPTDIPKDPIKIGGMNALLAGVLGALKRNSISPESFFSSSTVVSQPSGVSPPTNQDASDAVWSESEETLAMALQDMPTFQRRAASFAKKLSDPEINALEQVSLAADSVFQKVRLAARKRGLEAVFEQGTIVPFDPTMFDCYDDLEEHEPGIVLKQPIVKQFKNGPLVVSRGIVERTD